MVCLRNIYINTLHKGDNDDDDDDDDDNDNNNNMVKKKKKKKKKNHPTRDGAWFRLLVIYLSPNRPRIYPGAVHVKFKLHKVAL